MVVDISDCCRGDSLRMGAMGDEVMTLEEKEARYKWLRSQMRWHSRKGGTWHGQQSRWFYRQMVKVFTYSEIVSWTIRKRAPDLAKQVAANNSLLNWLKGK